MNPVVGTAVLLLVALMSTSVSARSLKDVCQNKYPAKTCVGKEGWFQMGKTHCVKAFLHTKPLTFDEAEKVCQKETNGNLVSIHSQDELVQVLCTMFRTSTWMGRYWIGLKRVNNVFKWTDGSSGMYRNFARGQPDNWRSREECVEMNYWRWGPWNDEFCGSRRHYVCAIKL